MTLLKCHPHLRSVILGLDPRIHAASAAALGGVGLEAATDQLGAGNLLTAERRLSALGLVKHGRVYDVSHEIHMGAPYMAPNQTPFANATFLPPSVTRFQMKLSPRLP